jgi:hypothetical protein
MDTAHGSRFLMLPIDHVTVGGGAVSQMQATAEDLGLAVVYGGAHVRVEDPHRYSIF